MALISVGRVCTKLAGRDSGNRRVIINILDDNFVMVTGPKKLTGVRRRKVNMKHLMPLNKTIRIRKNASDEAITKALGRRKLTPFMKGEKREPASRSKKT